MKVIEVYSEKETAALAEKIGRKAAGGDVYCLCGELGAGKTAFAKGFALGMGISCDIASPTFSIVNEYNGNINLYHFDFYRIKSLRELEDTGFEDYFYSGGVCLAEWADLVKAAIPLNAVWINIRKDLSKGDDYRLIEIDGEQFDKYISN